MEKEIIIDFHTHCFPDWLAPRAIEQLSKGAPNPAHYDGTENGLVSYMDRFNVSSSVVLNIATNAKQTTNVNNFAVQLNNSERLYAFGSVNPQSLDFKEQIDSLIDRGVKGLKFHPFYQNFVINGKEMYEIYDYINRKKLIAIFHMGFDTAFEDDGRAAPLKLVKIHNEFPDITLIAAHMGGYGYHGETVRHIAGTDIYLETSFGLRYFDKSLLAELFKKHDKNRILFGTDGPWNSLGSEIELMRKYIKDKAVYDMVMYKNAQNLLGKK